jgi:hypothetical protein
VSAHSEENEQQSRHYFGRIFKICRTISLGESLFWLSKLFLQRSTMAQVAGSTPDFGGEFAPELRPLLKGVLSNRILRLICSTDIVGCQAALFEWAESYDTKDWERLGKCITPTLRVRSFMLSL